MPVPDRELRQWMEYMLQREHECAPDCICWELREELGLSKTWEQVSSS